MTKSTGKRKNTYASLCGYYAEAIRIIRLMESKFRPGMTRGDVAAIIMDAYPCSCATAYRHAGGAIYAMGLAIDDSTEARAEHALARRRKRNGAVFHAS